MVKEQLQGLDPQQVERSRQEHGINVITPAKRESVWKLFIGKFNDPIIKILLVAAFLSLAVAFIDGHYVETIGIFVAIFLATGISFWFEYDAKKRFEILNTVNDDALVKVVRSSEIDEIPRKDVVVGDIVVLQSGDEVPADGKLLEAVSLQVNESALTGEPMASKTTDPGKFKKDATYSSDMLMRGSNLLEGYGTIEVTAVGDATEFGKVAIESTVSGDTETPLNIQLSRLSKILGKVGAILSVAIFFILFVKGVFFGEVLMSDDWVAIAGEILGYFMVSVAVMVMAVPEGLPMSITLSLAMSMRRMLKTNNLVRKMHACETMGAVTVICTDKTGTLTRNQMRVSEIKLYTDIGEEDFSRMIAANSTAFLDHDHKVIGNPTEGALLLWMDDKGYDYQDIRRSVEIIDQMTFTTERKYMATLVKGNGSNILYVKGAPEIVKEMSTHSEKLSKLSDELAGFQNKAMRTLGFAFKQTKRTTCEDAIRDRALDFVGIAAISDPVREDVPAAVKECLDAGIDIKIITGDTPATAREIARQIGLWNDDVDGDENQITGVEFEGLSDDELWERVKYIKIMSRARPLDKQRMVKLLQQNGEVVAVTGDGTNDAPALNFAQVGLSMGSGTSVAKEASDITLLDDSFASIATAVMWGRSLYKNIQRFVMFQLTVNFAALVIVFFGSIFGGELPLTVTQILWVNLIMDTFAALALASLPPSPKVMDEKPRRQSDFIINRNMLQWIGGVGLVIIITLMSMMVIWGAEMNPYQLSVFFTVFVLMQFWNLFNARVFGSEFPTEVPLSKCRGFLFILLVILLGQILITSIGGEVFRTVPLTLRDWVYIVGATSLIAIGGSLCRYVYHNFISSKLRTAK